jgi:hypothetical protein
MAGDTCIVCGGLGQACCANNPCTDNNAICGRVDGGRVCVSCGGDGEACCGNNRCDTGMRCTRAVCRPTD